MAAAVILKITIITISSQRFDHLCEMWYHDSKWVSWKVRISKSNMSDGRHFEKKLLNRHIDLCNSLTDFDEIWHGDVHGPLTADRPFRFRISENPRWRQPLSWKSQNHNISTKVWPIVTKFGMLMQNWSLNRSHRYKIWISKIQDGGRPLFWKPLNRHISATVWPILMKFGRVTHIGPLQRRDRENYEVFDIQHGCGLHLENRDISITVWPIFAKVGVMMQNGFLNHPDR